MNIAKEVEGYIKHLTYGSVFTHKQLVNRLNGHGSRISQSLAILKENNVVMPIDRGLWMRPKKTRFGIVYASPEKIVAALEADRNILAVPAGAAALNEIGASTQLGMVSAYVTTKRIEPITVGKTVIHFRHSRSFENAAAKLKGLSKPEKHQAAKIWVALEYAGQKLATEEIASFRKAFERLSLKAQEKLLAATEIKISWAKSLLEEAYE
ncbi:DUF6088 family protein [Nitrincola sp. MINF-07-Sa-05]|uniref:DUF6088 family protein n=1 Tax=Nitrincola salilacus TaxID=3400273 RepID=UPI0039183ECF